VEKSNKILSELTINTKYAKFIPEKQRRETWSEICDRTQQCLITKYPGEEQHIVTAMNFVRRKEVMCSMRMMQFGGIPVDRNNSRVYNCAYHAADHKDFFANTMFLLLGGSGVGYSVQDRHISELPAKAMPKLKGEKIVRRKFLISDTIEGWADSVKVLMDHYFLGTYRPRFDYSDIRAKGVPLITAGGKAPGPEPLRTCLSKIMGLMDSKRVGERLTSTEVSDLCCFIADAVYSGGIRRAAMICLFDMDDEAMLGYKSGQWWESTPERARVNVSAVGLRENFDDNIDFHPEILPNIIPKTTKEQYMNFWKFVENSGSGEPGIYWTNDPDWGTNPCVEIALKSKQFCNLTTINFSTVKDQKDLIARAKTATYLGTLQAGFTDFHYLGEEWIENCEEEALIGVSLTGIADGNNYKGYDWKSVSQAVVERNAKTAMAIGINSAARTTCIKPEGTTSLVCGSSSGIHARHAHYYIRRLRYEKSEPIAIYLSQNHPELITQDLQKPSGVVVEIPQKSPDRSVYRSESVFDLLERVKYFSEEWVKPGHLSGTNTHNVSCTISVKPDEWKGVGEWMWKNKDFYNGIAVLPYDDHSYVQPPFEDCTKEKYEKMMAALKRVDLTKIQETEDNTEQAESIACAGGACLI